MKHLNPSTEACYSVTALTREIKALLETAYPVVRIRGEISNLRRQASGHVYFSLKDAGASISCVCFRNDAMRLPLRLRDGLQVLGSGRLAVYEPRGNYQVIFRTLEEDGVGRLQQAFLELKEKLGAEGLFDKSRKKPLPRLPGTIAFVTSASGAALRDFISILERRRWGGRLIVIPARVQGTGAAAEIVRGIETANRESLCDLLVIGRGGGSLEDLWPFNEESLARAVAASRIPLISAVGHETDFTLSDFAADLRAETPSAAAEWITSAWQNLIEQSLSLTT
ncbi:MAG: exodeoxyribonuclease VII large subunit, partial [Oceanipulchritudo sp.]